MKVTTLTDGCSASLESLDYFVEWGGKAWVELVYYAITNCLGEELRGKSLLDIGTSSGKMATLFALLGASVTGIDISEACLEDARNEVNKFGVNGVQFRVYDGDLDVFRNATFDIVFTKSVLVKVPDLRSYLIQINSKLKPNGSVVFLENGKGNILVRALRKLGGREANYGPVNYFDHEDIQVFEEVFEISEIRKSQVPPVYLIHGTKRM